MEEISMKQSGFIIIALMVLVCGFAMADRGIDPVPETQGITTATTLDLVGNFASTTDIQWRITDDFLGLDGIPPLSLSLTSLGSTYYASAYTEDTYSNGVGLIAYDKNLDVETSEQLSGQWNIDADKQIEFVGVDGARIYSDEYIMVDGVGDYAFTPLEMLCVFASDSGIIFPAYCNFAESGSTVDMTVVNVRTNSMDRFIVPTSDTSVELEHDVLVTELIDGVPSSGTASAYMNVLIQEARGVTYVIEVEDISPLAERIEFEESSSVTGDISVFDKQMNYNSVLTGSGVVPDIIFPNGD
jgi:hypothetical protein